MSATIEIKLDASGVEELLDRLAGKATINIIQEPRDLISLKDFAKLTGYKESTLRSMNCRGVLPFETLGGKTFYRLSKVRQVMKSHSVKFDVESAFATGEAIKRIARG